MRVSFRPGYSIPLPEGHPFPIDKFTALHEILVREGVICWQDVVGPEEVSWKDLKRVHSREYLSKLRDGKLTPQEQRRMGLPWTPGLVRRSRLAVQGTINAARFALEDGLGANLAGGTHHAFADRGEGFCVLNDVAVAIRVLRRQGLIRRVLVVDLDVHQGNGTAAIFKDDPEVYTFSAHGAKNFPFRKEESSYDLPLPDGMEDGDYLSETEAALHLVFEASRPDLIFYLAGVDPVAGDRFGRLNLTRRGLHERDRLVLQFTWRTGIPTVLLLSGGYAKTPWHTADLHAVLQREARYVYG
ncbi:MAG TPA: histone deacetylase [Acidobacteriota bacterium]|nr:histone deacetylase [Acidobacteriota bacterium]